MLEWYRSSDSRMDRTSPRPSDQLAYLVAYCMHIQIQVVNTFAGIRNLEQEQVVSLVQFPPTRSIVSLNSTGLYRHANVIVFPYCEWWASRYQLAPCQSQVDSKLD